MKIHGRSIMSDFIPSMRASISDVWIPQYRRAVQEELKREAAQAAQTHKDYGVISEHAEAWNVEMIKIQQPIALAMQIDGYRLTESEFGKTGYCWRHALDHIIEIGEKVSAEAGEVDGLSRKMQICKREIKMIEREIRRSFGLSAEAKAEAEIDILATRQELSHLKRELRRMQTEREVLLAREKVSVKVEELELGFDADDLLARKLEPDVNDFVTSRTRSVTGTSLDRMATIVDASREAGLTIIEQATALQEGMFGQSRARSELIAQTATIWNYNHAAQFGYTDAGLVEKAWLVTDDDVLCEFCRPMEAEVADMNAEYRAAGAIVPGDEGGSLKLGFEVEHPPLHPRCRCAIIGVL